jgi:hypothetical protein
MPEYSVHVRGPKESVQRFKTLAFRSGAIASSVGTVTQLFKTGAVSVAFTYTGKNPPKTFEAIATNCGVKVVGIGPCA